MKKLHSLIIGIFLPLLILVQCKGGVYPVNERIDSIKQYLAMGGISENGEIIVFLHDDVNFISQSEWENDPKDFFDIGKLKVVAIWGGDISERITHFFSLCENIEELEMGGYDEGVFVTIDAAKNFHRFRNLKSLFISIYNLDNEIMEHISDIENLVRIDIFEPNALSLSLDRRYLYQKSYLTDDSMGRLKASESLKSIRIFGGGEDPITKISMKSLIDLLSMRSLESLEINKFCFGQSDWPTVQKFTASQVPVPSQGPILEFRILDEAKRKLP